MAEDTIFVKAQEEVVQSKNIIESLSFESLVPIMVAPTAPKGKGGR